MMTQQPDNPPPRRGAPFHPLASTLLLIVDNLWNLADWAAAAWILTVPLSFLSVFVPAVGIQRKLHGDSWIRAFLKGLFLGVVAAVPTSVTGTPIGIALLAWAGMDRGSAASKITSVSTGSPTTALTIAPEASRDVSSLPAPSVSALSQAPRSSTAHWVWLAIVIVLCATGLVATKMVLDRAGKLAGTVFDGTGRIAEKFVQGRITETFTAALPTLARAVGGNLELATATATETFTRTDERSIGWDMIPLGKTVTEITVPVTYRYHLRLQDPWRLEVRGATCVVYAPAIQPSQPPAIHSHKMQKRSEQGWARFNAQEQMTDLERSLTPTVARYAADPKHLALVREECRKTVAEFVRDWLLKEDHWRADRFHAIKVIFADEPDLHAEQTRPVVELK
jgi:hypothetical protein